jgi:ribulose 1,5-bisphosphate synthetase/thiazole synthase
VTVPFTISDLSLKDRLRTRSLIEGSASDIQDINEEFALRDGDRIAVVGGGPSGSFFSYFTLRMARMIGLDVKITIFEPKNFLARGPAGCNHCGGVVSEMMVQSLAVEGSVQEWRPEGSHGPGQGQFRQFPAADRRQGGR